MLLHAQLIQYGSYPIDAPFDLYVLMYLPKNDKTQVSFVLTLYIHLKEKKEAAGQPPQKK